MLVKIPTKNISNEGSQSANSRNTNPKAHLFIEIHDLQTREFPGRKIRHIYGRKRSYTGLLRTVFLPESRSVVYDRL
jgi:hypothetical protein